MMHRRFNFNNYIDSVQKFSENILMGQGGEKKGFLHYLMKWNQRPNITEKKCKDEMLIIPRGYPLS